MYDVIIIGAGASGLMAAAAAASKGARVALLEHKDDIGKQQETADVTSQTLICP